MDEIKLKTQTEATKKDSTTGMSLEKARKIAEGEIGVAKKSSQRKTSRKVEKSKSFKNVKRSNSRREVKEKRSQKWTNTTAKGSEWTNTTANGSEWTNTTAKGSEWTNTTSKGSVFNKDRGDPNLSEKYPKLSKKVKREKTEEKFRSLRKEQININ